jgi:carbamate kinase
MRKCLRIFALGGNEVAPTDIVDPETGKTINPDIPAQWRRAAKTCDLLSEIIQTYPDDYFVVTHGNGPQVGNLLLRSEYSLPILPPIPLDVMVADTQGAMGFMLAHIANALRVRGIKKELVTTVTQVVVDPDDPDFKDPSKFIGPAYTNEQAHEKKREGQLFKLYKKDHKGEEIWRRVVGSPKPIDIVEIEVIEANLKAGFIPIAVGGGGIPVRPVEPRIDDGEEIYECRHDVTFRRACRSEKSAVVYSGVDAVIDKDLASSLLGTMLIRRAAERKEDLEAEFIIFTNVDGAKLNFGEPNQKDLRLLTAAEAQQLCDDGNFPAGSMGPKIQAAINFVRGGGKKACITAVASFRETLAGNAGTTIVP